MCLCSVCVWGRWDCVDGVCGPLGFLRLAAQHRGILASNASAATSHASCLSPPLHTTMRALARSPVMPKCSSRLGPASKSHHICLPRRLAATRLRPSSARSSSRGAMPAITSAVGRPWWEVGAGGSGGSGGGWRWRVGQCGCCPHFADALLSPDSLSSSAMMALVMRLPTQFLATNCFAPSTSGNSGITAPVHSEDHCHHNQHCCCCRQCAVGRIGQIQG